MKRKRFEIWDLGFEWCVSHAEPAERSDVVSKHESRNDLIGYKYM